MWAGAQLIVDVDVDTAHIPRFKQLWIGSKARTQISPVIASWTMDISRRLQQSHLLVQRRGRGTLVAQSLIAPRAAAACSTKAISCKAPLRSGQPFLPNFGRRVSLSHVPRCVAMPANNAESMMSIDANEAAVVLTFQNNDKADVTVITLEAQDQTYLLTRLTGAFNAAGLVVVSAIIKSNDGKVADQFDVRGANGHKLPETEFESIRSIILSTLSSTNRSNKPAIYDSSDVQSLEFAAAEMAQAAAELVAKEREIIHIRKKKKSIDAIAMTEKETARAEAAAQLERKMSAMEAVMAAPRAKSAAQLERKMSAMGDVMAARRTRMALEPEEEKKAPSAAAMIEKMKPPCGTLAVTGASCGSGYEILLQGFNWESHKHQHYKTLKGQIKEIATSGFTAIWLPPPSDSVSPQGYLPRDLDSVSPQGYLPRDLYKLDSAYGTEQELRDLLKEMHGNGVMGIADIVINHRCASYQDGNGKWKQWNKFGGRLPWDASAVCSNNPDYGGTGAAKNSKDEYAAAPNIDHTQDAQRQRTMLTVRRDLGRTFSACLRLYHQGNPPRGRCKRKAHNPSRIPLPSLSSGRPPEKDNLKTNVRELLAVRKRNKLSCRSKVAVKKATDSVYAAVIDDKVAMKIGFGDWSPNSAGLGKFKKACSGFQFAVWEVEN
eukprot:gene5716-19000_t